MPVHLPPISRRRFLAGSLAATASFLLDRKLSAAGQETGVHDWALVSDAHVAADRKQTFRSVNMTDNFSDVAREITSLLPVPSAMLVTGDLAFGTGEAADYATFTELLRPVRESGIPVHLTLGNHDERKHFWNALAQNQSAPRPVADRQTALLRSPRANWFVLDSLEQTNSHAGILGDAQRAWLAAALDANPRLPALVVAHHNLSRNGETNALKDSAELLDIIRPRRHVKAYIFGHTHNWNVQQDASGIHLVNLPPTAYVFKPDRPNGWVRASLQPGGARLQLHCLNVKHQAHGQVTNLRWRPD